MTTRARTIRGVLAGLTLALAACGGGDDEAVVDDVGEAFADEPATAGETTTPPAAPAATTPSATAAGQQEAPAPVNRSDRELEGWRLSLVVADKTSFTADETIVFELTFTNVATQSQFTDAAQDLHFALATPGGEYLWTDKSCSGLSGDAPGEPHSAVEHPPGESGHYVGHYPKSPASGADRSACALPPGRYVALGQLDWCPPEALEDVTYREHRSQVCKPDAVRPLVSSPVEIVIEP